MSPVPEITVQNLDHLGLVAGLIDEIGIVEKINQLIGEKPGEIVSPGHVVKAMILNGLGLVSAPLYLFSKFFEGKATAHQEAKKKLRELAAQEFACEPDARAAANRLSKQLKYHNLTQLQIVPVLCESETNSFSRAESSQQAYKIQAQLEPDAGSIVRQTRAAGRFILATNVLDIDQLSWDEMITKYKEQQSCERGFAFLKDPLFFTDSVFLKSPERIEALALVMGLCLLVYSLGQRYLRSQLRQANSTLKNQLGQPTLTPTLRWIFQCFQAVHFLQVATVKQISNLTQERLDILKFFPASCRAYYLLMLT